MAWEATAKRCTPEFFSQHSVTELAGWSDYDLEMVGRLTHPMAYDDATDRYHPVSWEEAFAIIALHLNALPDPNMAEFYTSGRTSNEAAFLYQLFAREYGTNNFPDCSNMCHEATSVGLPMSLGVGKGTVLLDDFDKTDCIFIFGQNPGTNSPRMMTSLRDASRRGASIISFNPFRERALERFQSPQSPVEMATLTSTPISWRLHQVRVGGDIAVVKGIMKFLIEADDRALAEDDIEVLDWDFIRGHTVGIEALAADLRAASWDDIERKSGLTRGAIEEAADVYMKAERAIIVYGMGITQYNTTIYSLSDRYRGVYGQRDVLFLNPNEIEKRGLKPDDRVDLFTHSLDGVERVVRNFRLVPYEFPAGSCAAYYPETNPLVPLYAYDEMSFTPSYKGIPIKIVRSGASAAAARPALAELLK